MRQKGADYLLFQKALEITLFVMKYIIPFLLVLGVSHVFASDMPRGAFKASEFEAARAKAVETGKPLAIILTSFSGSCPHTEAGNESVEKEMKRDYVLVYDVPRTLTGGDGPLVRAMSTSMRAKGNIVPCVAVVEPKTLNYLGGASYKVMKADMRKWEKDLSAEIESARSELPASEEEETEDQTPTSGGEAASGSREWTNAKGQTILASVVSHDILHVTFKMEDGTIVKYPLNLLSAESREAIEAAN